MTVAKVFSPRDMQNLARWVVKNGDAVMSERGKTHEIIGAALRLRDPINRLDAHRYRRLNFPFAVAEWLAMMCGEERLSYFTKFISTYGDYSTDGIVLDGAYGPRLVTSDGHGAIRQIFRMLRDKPESRRAVATIYNNNDLVGGGGKNTPCTISMHFMQRDSKLHMLTYMRSNDVHYGLTNDVIVFTMTQEFVANRLGIGLGEYHHFAGSLHVYNDLMKIFSKRERTTREGRWPHTMQRMPEDFDWDELQLLYSTYVRVNDLTTEKQADDLAAELRTDYSRNLLYSAAAFLKRNSNPDLAAIHLQKIEDPTIKRITNFWLAK